MTTATEPFRDFEALAREIPAPDPEARAAARRLLERGPAPIESLGQLGDLAIWVAGVQGAAPPHIDRPTLAVFASSHGVAARGIADIDDRHTAEHMALIQRGGGVVARAAESAGAALKLFDLGVDQPTEDLSRGAAMSERECAGAIAYGFEAIAGDADILALGAMAAGGTTAAAAVAAALYGGDAGFWARAGSFSAGENFDHKVAVVREALATHRGALTSPLEILRRLGGRELAGLVGAILAAGRMRTPVVLDGFTTTVAAAIAHSLAPRAVLHCLAGSVSAKPAHRAVLERIGLPPLLDLGIGLGDGVGAAVALGVLETAVAICARGGEGAAERVA